MANLSEKFKEAVSRYSARIVITYCALGKWEEVSYNELNLRVEKFAKFLTAKDIGKGDNLAIMLENGPNWPAVFFACLSLGAAGVPINPGSSRDEVERIIKDSGSKLLFTEKELASAELETSAGLNEKPGVTETKAPEGGAACILYTSGTTDVPKGVILTHDNLLSNCESIHSLGLITSKDSVFSILPLYHAYPLTVTMILPILYGSRIIYPENLKSETITEAMRKTAPTIFVGVPRIYGAFHKKIEENLKKIRFPFNILFNLIINFLYLVRKKTNINPAKYLLYGVHEKFGKNMRLFISGGAKLDENIASDLFKLGFTILEGYGLTETSPVLTFNPLSRPKIGSAGKAIPNVEIALSNKNKDGIGEVIARGPNVMKGYYKRQDLTDEVIKNGWFYTGDLGFIDSDGYLFLTGRVKDVIVLSSGKNVYPDEVEKAYSGEIAIKDICVFEAPSGKGNQTDTILWAAVVPNLEFFRRVDAVNLKQVIKERLDNISRTLPPHMRLMGFSITLDELPRTLLGKVKRGAVKEIYVPKIMEEKKSPSIELKLSEEDSALMALESTKKIIACLEGQTKPERKIVPADLLELDLGIDSLGRIELASNLERAFNMRLGDEILGRVFTVRDLIIDIERASSGKYEFSDTRLSAARDEYWHKLLEIPPREENLKTIDLAPGIGSHIFTFFLHGLIYLIFRIFYNLKIEGKENVPQKGPYILYVNHASYFDGFLAAVSMPPFSKKDLFFVGYRIYFNAPFVRKLIKIARGIPLDFSGHFLEALRSSFYVLKNGKNLCLFPEGMRTLDGKIGEFKKGFGILAVERDAQLVPLLIQGAFEAWPRTAKFPKRSPITVKIGKPITCKEAEEKGYKLGAKDRYEAVCLGAREALLALR